MVRRIHGHEGEALLRTVRLDALRDAPAAFASSYDQDAAYPVEEWSARARSGAEGRDSATCFALNDTRAVGLVGGFRSGRYAAVVDLVSMWTSPVARGSGVGRALVGAVAEWSREIGMAAVELWVTRGNEPAQRLYEWCGFIESGDFQPPPSDRCRGELRMRLAL